MSKSGRLANGGQKNDRGKPPGPKPPEPPGEAGHKTLGQDERGNLAETVGRLLKRVETKLLQSNELTATITDFVRLLQLHKDLGGEQPREIVVRWVGSSEEECVTKT